MKVSGGLKWSDSGFFISGMCSDFLFSLVGGFEAGVQTCFSLPFVFCHLFLHAVPGLGEKTSGSDGAGPRTWRKKGRRFTSWNPLFFSSGKHAGDRFGGPMAGVLPVLVKNAYTVFLSGLLFGMSAFLELSGWAVRWRCRPFRWVQTFFSGC